MNGCGFRTALSLMVAVLTFAGVVQTAGAKAVGESAYFGTWREAVDDFEFALSFSTNHTGWLVSGRDTGMFVWREAKAGRLECTVLGPQGRPVEIRVLHDSGKNTMRIDIPENERGLKGVLSFAGADLPKELTEPDGPDIVDAGWWSREAERKISSGDARLVEVKSFSDLPDYDEIIDNNLIWETVDGKYPRVVLQQGYAGGLLDLYVYTGRYMGPFAIGGKWTTDGGSDGSESSAEGRGGPGAEESRRGIEFSEKCGIKGCSKDNPHGCKYSYWRENGFEIWVFEREKYKEGLRRFMKEYIDTTMGYPRYAWVRKNDKEPDISREEMRKNLLKSEKEKEAAAAAKK